MLPNPLQEMGTKNLQRKFNSRLLSQGLEKKKKGAWHNNYKITILSAKQQKNLQPSQASEFLKIPQNDENLQN